MLADLASSVLLIIAVLIFFAGGFGEGLALYVLYRGSEPADACKWVLVAHAAPARGPSCWPVGGDRSEHLVVGRESFLCDIPSIAQREI